MVCIIGDTVLYEMMLIVAIHVCALVPHRFVPGTFNRTEVPGVLPASTCRCCPRMVAVTLRSTALYPAVPLGSGFAPRSLRWGNGSMRLLLSLREGVHRRLRHACYFIAYKRYSRPALSLWVYQGMRVLV